MSRRKKMFVLFMIIIIFLALIIIPLSNKIWLLRYYQTDNFSFSMGIEMWLEIAEEPLIINIEKSVPPGYLEFKEIKVGNYFHNYQTSEIGSSDDNVTYIYRVEEKTLGLFAMGISDKSWYDLAALPAEISSNYINNYYDQQLSEKLRFNEIDRQAILDKYTVTDDLSFFRFVAKNHDRKSTLFSSKEEIIENFCIKSWANILSSPTEPVKIIEGDYSGYVVKYGHTTEVKIIKNNKFYSFGFYNVGETADFEFIKKVMNTVIIKDA